MISYHNLSIFCVLLIIHSLNYYCGIVKWAMKINIFRPPSDGGLMILPETKVRTFVHRHFTFFRFDKKRLQQVTTGYHGLPRVTTGYHGLPRVTTGYFWSFWPCCLYGLQRAEFLVFSWSTKQVSSFEPIKKISDQATIG